MTGSCTFSGGSGSPTCDVTSGGLSWTGDIPAASSLTIDYQVQVGAGAPAGSPLCIETVFDPGAGADVSITACATVDCPVSPTSVELRYFRAIGLAERAVLVWETATEADTHGFNVYRAAGADRPWTQVNAALIPAEGSAAAGRAYILRDAPGAGTWHYRLEDLGAGGKRTPHPATEVEVGPDAGGRELLLPRAEAARAGRPAGAMSAENVADAKDEAPDGSPGGWLASWWRWLTE